MNLQQTVAEERTSRAAAIVTPEDRRRDLAERMRIAGIDQTDLAREWGVTRAAVSQRLRGQITMDMYYHCIAAMRRIHERRARAFD